MTYLADINVLVALVVIGHVHHPAALRWIDHSGGEVAVCRVAQMGFLRLLTNARVMGENVVSATKAWDIFAAMFEDPRFVFHPEPTGLEAAWRPASRHPHSGPNFWTDAYLAAFAYAAGIGIVTFDAALAWWCCRRPPLLHIENVFLFRLGRLAERRPARRGLRPSDAGA